MKDKSSSEEFCEILGVTPRNRVLECFIEGREMDFSSGSIAETTELNRATTYRVIEQLEKEEFILPTRKVSGAQLYKINKVKREVRVLITIFDMILDKIEEEYNQKTSIKQRKELIQTI